MTLGEKHDKKTLEWDDGIDRPPLIYNAIDYRLDRYRSLITL